MRSKEGGACFGDPLTLCLCYAWSCRAVCQLAVASILNMILVSFLMSMSLGDGHDTLTLVIVIVIKG